MSKLFRLNLFSVAIIASGLAAPTTSEAARAEPENCLILGPNSHCPSSPSTVCSYLGGGPFAAFCIPSYGDWTNGPWDVWCCPIIN